jgi:hypothetical protein
MLRIFFVIKFYVLFVCIVVGQTGNYVEFLLLFDNLPMNYITIHLCFGCQFFLIFGVTNYLSFVGCLMFFALICFFIQQSFAAV